MSEIGSEGINDLITYLDKHKQMVEEALGTSGLLYPLALRVFDHSFKQIDSSEFSDKVSSNIFEFQKDEVQYCDVLFYKALNLAKQGVVYKQFGMNFQDLLQLDYTTFCDIDEAAREEMQRKSKTMDEVKDELESES